MLKLSKFIFLLFIYFIGTVRAESVKFLIASEKKPTTLYLFPGRVSLLNLPCPITKALVGSPNDIKTEIDKLNSTDAHILLKRWRASPSNLILKCSDKVFLFNLLPSKKTHYDYIQVVSHIKPTRPLKVKSPRPNTPSQKKGGLREGEDFTIRKILDFSWSNNK